jgi:hypothetical protein
MTAKTTRPEATMGDTAADQLRALGTRGVLVQMAQRGQIIEPRCEMPKCYCHRGEATSSRDPLLCRIGHPLRTTTPG